MREDRDSPSPPPAGDTPDPSQQPPPPTPPPEAPAREWRPAGPPPPAQAGWAQPLPAHPSQPGWPPPPQAPPVYAGWYGMPPWDPWQAWQQQAWQQQGWGQPPAVGYAQAPIAGPQQTLAAGQVAPALEPPLAWRGEPTDAEAVGATSSTPYVVELVAPLPQRSSRVWAILSLLLVKPMLLLPHFLLLAVFAVIAWFAFFFAQIVVIFSASYPRGWYDFVAGTLRWSVRVRAFLLGLTDRYPPFTFKGCDRCPYPVDLVVYRPPRNSRLWAINVVLSMISVAVFIEWDVAVWLNSRTAATLPHVLIVAPIWAAAVIAWLVATIVVIGRGRYPRGLHALLGGLLLWTARIEAFWLGLEDRFPPFELPQPLAEPPARVWREPVPAGAAAVAPATPAAGTGPEAPAPPAAERA